MPDLPSTFKIETKLFVGDENKNDRGGQRRLLLWGTEGLHHEK